MPSLPMGFRAAVGAVLRSAFAAGIVAVSMPGTAQPLPPEVQVGSGAIIDYEFDWGRDGVYCPTCNYGAGNSRFSFIDKQNNLWVGTVDFNTGAFFPIDGKGTLVDTNATAPNEIGNGPEWMASARGSELLYDRWTDGQPKRISNLTLGFARMGGGSWVAGPVDGSQNRVLPVGTFDLADPVPSVHYQTFSTGSLIGSIYWRDVTPGAVEQRLPINSSDPAMTRRWVPNSRDVIITAPARPNLDGLVFKQVFLYHTSTGVLEQLTYDPVDKLWAFMWQAPEFGNENVFSVVVDADHLNIYRNLPRSDGTSRWHVVNSIAMPAATPYISSPEPFVHNGRSWVFFTLSSNPDLHDYTANTLVAMTGIDPAVPSLRLLTSDVDPPRARKDPEYFITANGPYIYYNRYLPPADGRPQISEGVFRVDTGLGPRLP